MIALGPIAIYFLVLGAINLDSRPTLVNGMGDAAALGIAICGCVVAGPMELFLPEAAAMIFGWGIWPLLLTFYFVCLTLYVLLMRPRLVFYNMTAEQLRPVLAEVISQLDPQARIAGESVYLPNLGVQLHSDLFPLFKNIQLRSAGSGQNHNGWRELELALHAALRGVRGSANPYGVSLVTFALAMLCCIGYWLSYDGIAITEAWREMMRFSE